MKSPAVADQTAPSLTAPWTFQVATAAAFFLGFFLYVWLVLEPAGEYYSQGAVFFLNGSFLRRFLIYPGGLVDYGSAFLAQLNCWSWLGALVFTALGGLLFLGACRLCLRLADRASLLVCLAPSLVLLGWRGRYEGPVLAAGLGLGLAIGGALGGLSVRRCAGWLRCAVWWVVGSGLYYAAGLWPLVMFLFFVGWSEVVRNQKWFFGLVFPALCLPLACPGVSSAQEVLNPWGKGQSLVFAGLLFLCLPVGLLILVRLPRPVAPLDVPARRPRQTKGSKVRGSPPRRPWAKPALTIGSLLAGGALAWGLIDGRRQALARIEGCAALGQDERLLEMAARLDHLPPASEVRVRLALYHTGRLTQDLFSFAGGGSGNLLPGLKLGLDACRAQSQTLLELGQVNEAEHQAQEALEVEGDRPDVLRLLAQVNVLRDRPKAAAVFLNVLRQVPFQRTWAANRIAQLEQNPKLTGDRDLDLARSRMVNTDLPHDALVTELMLRQLLQSNPRNQMAFEYLMAEYLLTGDFKRLAQHTGQFEDFSYPAIPRHVEEALLLGDKLRGVQFDLHGRAIRPQTIRRFQSFCAATAGRSGSAAIPLAPLASEFGDTFWFYYFARLAPRLEAGN